MTLDVKRAYDHSRRMELVRVSVGNDGAFGVLIHSNYPFAVTLEPTYTERRHIKIPPGRWKCRKSFFHRGGYRTFEVEVPNHSRILFHRGNVEPDTDGCILVAKSFGWLRGRAAILDSRKGFAEFLGLTKDWPDFDLFVFERRWKG